MKCRISVCKASCCYNIPFERDELRRFSDRIVNPVLFTLPLGAGTVAFTDKNINKNKCPFLRKDCKCNIYDVRPDICRKFGEIAELTCYMAKEK